MIRKGFPMGLLAELSTFLIMGKSHEKATKAASPEPNPFQTLGRSYPL